MRVSFNAKIVFDLDDKIPMTDADLSVVKYLEARGIKTALDVFGKDNELVLNFEDKIVK